jgi:Spy/CpxP family protein refolding chaperone
MDFFTKNKMLFWCVMILVVLNVVTLASFWLKKPHPARPAGVGGQPNGQGVMEEQLGLSPEQARTIEQLREEHFMRTRPLQEQRHRIRLHLLDEVFAPQPDEALIEELVAELGAKESEFERNLYMHFQELKDVCTPDQIKELKIMLRDLIERTRPRDPQGARGGRPPGHRPPPPQ